MIDCVSQTAKTQGIGALYSGLGPRMTRDVIGSALIFGVYHKVKNVVESFVQ